MSIAYYFQNGFKLCIIQTNSKLEGPIGGYDAILQIRAPSVVVFVRFWKQTKFKKDSINSWANLYFLTILFLWSLFCIITLGTVQMF